MKNISTSILVGLSLATATTAYSQEEDDRRRDRRGPPPVAIEACAAAVEGDACTFEGRRGEALEGLCVTAREEVLACRPDGPPPHPRHRDENDRQQAESIG